MRVVCADCGIDMQYMEKSVFMCLNCGNAVRVVEPETKEEVKQ